MPEDLDVTVDGGTLRVARWAGSGDPVLAIHGVTATSRSWPFLADQLENPVLAPDLRGRGRSHPITDRSGMAVHADDCAAVLHELAAGPVVVVGHSMGGFVASALAARHPELVSALVLVDGGLPFPPADEKATAAGLQPILQRLERTFTRDSYRDWYRGLPAFATDWTPQAQAYADYDLLDDPGRPSSEPAVVQQDQLDLMRADSVTSALDSHRQPRVFLHAPRGFADDPPGLYPQPTVDSFAGRWPDLTIRRVDDVNHYTIVLSPRGAAAIADEVRTVTDAVGAERSGGRDRT